MITTNDIISTSNDLSLKQKDFQTLYIASRKKENRVYTDEQVLQLPGIEPLHVHAAEWETRKRSAERLIHYLKRKNKPLKILEVGCGNGWLSAMLASIKNVTVLGIDINKIELVQAIKVFEKKQSLSFAETDIRTLHVENKFDVIVFAASIQYFSSFENIIEQALSLLDDAGEIHLLDSYFYSAGEVENARQRSRSYYHSIGFEEMAEFYFHHKVDSVIRFNYKLLFDPATIKNKIFGKKDLFPWICIKA